MSTETASVEHAATSPGSQYWQRLDRWLEDVSDYLNPILVKETRQALRSRQFLVWFLLLLAACWVVTIGGVVILGPAARYAAGGGALFLAYFYILAFALTVVVPFTAFRSLAAEQEDNTRDVLMVSALSPHQVINGKLGSAGLQMAVYLSALSPCLAFTYLLRGIDLLTIVLVPTAAVALSVFLSMMALLTASTTKNRFSQVFVSVLLVVALLGAFQVTCIVATEITQRNSPALPEAAFMSFGALMNAGLCAFLLAYYAATGMNTFASANRSSSLRRVMFFTQACFLGWIFALWRVSRGEEEVIFAAGCIAGVFWYVMGALLTSERPIFSERVRRGLPSGTLGRLLGSLFNPGPGTGYLFVLANMLTVCMALGIALIDSIEARSFATFLALGFSYIALFLGLGKLLIAGLRRLATLSFLGGFLIHFLLLLTGIGLPELLRATFLRYQRVPYSWFDVINPVRTVIALVDGDLLLTEIVTVLLVIPGGAVCVMLVNLVLAARELQLTRSPLPQRVIEDDAELHVAESIVANPWGDLRQPETDRRS